MAYNLINRLGKRLDEPRNKCYKDHDIKCRVGENPAEVYEYIINNFYNDIKQIIDDGEVPSIDRIDSTKDYEEGNIRIITFEENSRLGREQSFKVWQRPIKITLSDGSSNEYEGIKAAGEKSEISQHILGKILSGKTKQKEEYYVEYL